MIDEQSADSVAGAQRRFRLWDPSTFAVRLSSMKRIRYHGQLALMLAPYLLGLTILVAIPAVAGLPLAFTAYNAIEPPRFVGLDNFREMLDDRIFRIAVLNTATFALMAIPAKLLGALLLALLLTGRLRFGRFYRAAIYLPTVVPDIAWALLWLWLLNPIYGPINLVLGSVGIPGPAWMVEEWGARFAIAFMMSWQLGEAFVVCLAAIQDVPKEVLDQAAVDGASTVRTMLGVTLPLIAPVLLILLFRDTIFSLQSNFVPALIVGRGGGPNYATTYLPLHIYTNAFDYLRFGYAAAMTWSLFLITGSVLWLQYRVAVRWRLGFRDAE
ncbi:MAG: carbohydrate ABC transporter permease [Thermomicrobiales bacterium]